MQILKKIAKNCLYSAITLIALYVAFIVYVQYFVDLNKYKEPVFQAIEKETGFKPTCENIEFKKQFNPYLKIHLYHTGVLYPDKSVFLQIKDSYLRIKILPLIFKKIEIKDVKLERPIVNITLYKDFSTSLEKYITNKKFNFNKLISEVNSSHYKIKFKDDSIGKTFYLEGDELSLSKLKNGETIHITADGAVFENKKKYLKYDFNILTPLNFQNRHFSFSPFKTIKDFNIKGKIYGHLKTDKKNHITGNVKLEDLSLNLGNIISANNNLSLEFKGNEAKIKAIIHTSNKDSASVNGIFGTGKKRYIDLNTNAKNIDLENLFKIVSATTKILNIQNPLNDMSAKGMLNADFNLKSDLKKINSKGKAEIVNAIFSHNSVKYPITNVCANINFDNNEIKIEKASANINKTPVNIEGTVKNDLTADLKAYADNLDLKSIITAFLPDKEIPVEIKKGNIQFKTEIKGNLGNKFETKSDINIKDLFFTEKFSKIPVKANNIKINVNEKYVEIPKNVLTILNSPVEIKGIITNYSDFPLFKLDFEGDINSNDFASIISKYFKQPCKVVGKLNTKGNIEIENGKLRMKSQIKANKDNYISYIVIKELLNKPSVTKIDMETDKDILTINDISINSESEPVLKLNGQIENLRNPELKNIKFTIPKEITVGANFFGGEEISLKSDLILNKNLKFPEIKGNVKLYKYNLKKYLTSIKNADIGFMPGNIRITAPDTVVNNSKFNITADILPDFENITVSNLQINSTNLDLNSLFDIIRDLQSNKFKIAVKQGSTAINNFKISDIKARDVVSDFKIEKNILKMYNIKANAYSGTVEGSADYEISTGILDIDMSGKNLNIKNSLYDLSGFDDNILGQTDIKAKVSMLTGSRNTVIKTLSGEAEFNSGNGSMGTLGKFEYYLYAKNLLYHGFINTTINRLIQTISHMDTTHYNFANGKVQFQNGFINTNGIYTRGYDMSLYIKGRHNMYTNLSNLEIYGRISDEISKRLGNFADVSISDILNGQENKKSNMVIFVPDTITEEIPQLILGQRQKSNMFKVVASGDIKALNAINSFTWILPESIRMPSYNRNLQVEKENIETVKNTQTEEEIKSLPDFSDL